MSTEIEFDQATVQKKDDGSFTFVTVGGTDPTFTPDEAAILAEFLTDQPLDLRSMSKADLQVAAADAGVSTSGTKADLIDNIENAPADVPAEAAPAVE